MGLIRTPGMGERLKDARRLSRLTQEDVAGVLGANPNSVSQWENNDRAISEERLVILAKLYEKPVEWFLWGEADTTVKYSDLRFSHLTKRVAELPTEYQAIVENVVENLVDDLAKQAKKSRARRSANETE